MMNEEHIRAFTLYKNRSETLEKRWQQICERYLPVIADDSIWRYHDDGRRSSYELTQGWKLHVSATVLNAGKMLKKIAPFLASRGVQFKAPRSLKELVKINSGLDYGYSQIGKIVTVYPRTPEEAVALAKRLHKMTRRMAAPSVPFDRRFSPSSNVYYRFGAFKNLEIEHANGVHSPAMRDLKGELVPDVREAAEAKPDWVSDPFNRITSRYGKRKSQSPFAKSFRIFRALAQRGKGGVYQAVDLSTDPPRLCLLKEGRKNGEISWDGRDGYCRIRNEERVLSLLRERGVAVPRVYSSFELERNYYLITEFIEGESLQSMLLKFKRRLSVSRVFRYGIQLSSFFCRMHSAGWVWRDCKPQNILVTPKGRLRPIDFEGACPVDRPDPTLWGTRGFAPIEWRDGNAATGFSVDLYALGSMLYLLLTGRIPQEVNPTSIEKLRRDVPQQVREMVTSLLSPSPFSRPSAKSVTRGLKAAMQSAAIVKEG